MNKESRLLLNYIFSVIKIKLQREENITVTNEEIVNAMTYNTVITEIIFHIKEDKKEG